MNPRIIVKAFFIVLIIFIIISLSYFCYLKYFAKKTTTTPTITDQSGFKKLDLKRYESDTEELLKILTTKDYWDNWSWEEKMVETEIIEILPETTEFIVRISRPINQEFSRLRQRVKVDCPSDQTIKVSSVNPTSTLSDGGFNIFDEAAKQDIFYSYCLDQNCLNVGKECVLVKMKKANE
ncbi:hypothetical protein A2V49_04250 [candidate division WWE3 bacterium RBG_19FT_COMBO_34_6]|uniref:Uncharacterized protein n=1 Tax=candidate division WWE3 bacterium RBG_19FT_COMBO_34_6 TaxID=1802612 RepID=A0A1F4UND4_UNCKA|nr:MAG: hypothetical protein A2V49_04250 [candidate division WWE3 bacterium RBG_19FT_COMBO_34_6]